MKSCIPILIFSLICCQKLRLKNIIFLNHHFCVNNRNRIRRIATESELLQNGGGKKKGTRILPLYYGNHSSTNDDLLSTTIPTRGKLRHSLVIIQTFTLLIEFDYSSMRPPIRFDWWISFTDFSCFFFFILFRKQGTPARRNKAVLSSRRARTMQGWLPRRRGGVSWAGNFREERRERVYAGGEEKDTKGEGAWKGLLASAHTRVHVFKRAYPSSPPPFPRNPPV